MRSIRRTDQRYPYVFKDARETIKVYEWCMFFLVRCVGRWLFRWEFMILLWLIWWFVLLMGRGCCCETRVDYVHSATSFHVAVMRLGVGLCGNAVLEVLVFRLEPTSSAYAITGSCYVWLLFVVSTYYGRIWFHVSWIVHWDLNGNTTAHTGVFAHEGVWWSKLDEGDKWRVVVMVDGEEMLFENGAQLSKARKPRNSFSK